MNNFYKIVQNVFQLNLKLQQQLQQQELHVVELVKAFKNQKKQQNNL